MKSCYSDEASDLVRVTDRQQNFHVFCEHARRTLKRQRAAWGNPGHHRFRWLLRLCIAGTGLGRLCCSLER
jgi:hypothetical protein